MFIRCFLLLLAFKFLSAGRVPQPEERIIGGYSIPIELVPWQVSVQAEGQFCGGSIYSKDIIITAAHCLFTPDGRPLKAEDFRIRVGSPLMNKYGTLVTVAAIKSHENFFNPFAITDGSKPHINFIVHDIGVMRLSKPLEFNNRVLPIPLAESSPAPGTYALSSGWGATYKIEEKNYILPLDLQGIWVKFDESPYCAGVPNNFCIRHHVGPTCNGDSGGPLVVSGRLVGVAYASNCFGEGLYTSVPYYREWILSAIGSV